MDFIRGMKFGVVLIVVLAFAVLVGCSPKEPTAELTSLEMGVVYSNNGVEGEYGIKVADFFEHAFAPHAEKSWEQIDDTTWAINVEAADKVTKEVATMKVVLSKLSTPDRVILQRVFFNGQELNGGGKDQMANQLAYNVSEKLKG